ncbi:MAG: methionine adenosyltransferase [Gammaproteobacteria bacterium]|nr:methionine adenosyltransferase [Gammaproteobacteria bacterium]
MHNLSITALTSEYAALPVEIVERKGTGHPDTICDALAEELSRALSQFYLQHFGFVMHHNVDKALLWGGRSQPRFGGGKIIEPMEIFIAGRATGEYKNIKVPLQEMIMQSSRRWLQHNFHVLDAETEVKIHSLIRPGSADLVELYLRQQKTGIALANDTSCGVGYAPLSELERMVLQIEKHLNSAAIKLAHPEIGEDIKVMGVRKHNSIDLTIACAFIDKFITDKNDYLSKKSDLTTLAADVAKKESERHIFITVNAADEVENGSFYLTVTGTSAESGDDGEVGRGNRVNGLITPYRPMNMEAAAGKNPVTHVGKLYNFVAQQIAESLVDELDEIREARCYLVSRIGSPISQPQVVDVQLYLAHGKITDAISKRVSDVVTQKLCSIANIRDQLIAGRLRVY